MSRNKRCKKSKGHSGIKRCKATPDKPAIDLYKASEIDEIARSIAMVLRREFLK